MAPCCLLVGCFSERIPHRNSQHIHKAKAEKTREKTIADQYEARRLRNKAARERKLGRAQARLNAEDGAETVSTKAP